MDSFLMFKLAKEKFAVSIRKVLEVILDYKIIKAPDSPDFIIGVINFRGDIVPVVDFQSKLGLKNDKLISNMLIVFEAQKSDKKNIFGVIVNEVNDVFEFSDNDIENIPDFGTKYKTDYLNGMIKIDEEFHMIMNVEKIFFDKEGTVSNYSKLRIQEQLQE